jgi:hypothetical protein
VHGAPALFLDLRGDDVLVAEQNPDRFNGLPSINQERRRRGAQEVRRINGLLIFSLNGSSLSWFARNLLGTGHGRSTAHVGLQK